jgi:hypothetical protein
MSKSKNPPTARRSPGPVDWSGTRIQRIEYRSSATIFTQGDAADSVMYIEHGAVRLSVLSHAGKEAVVAVLDAAHFFGEGCLAGQSLRMATATAMTPCTIVSSTDRKWCGAFTPHPHLRIGSSHTCSRGTSGSKKI